MERISTHSTPLLYIPYIDIYIYTHTPLSIYMYIYIYTHTCRVASCVVHVLHVVHHNVLHVVYHNDMSYMYHNVLHVVLR